MSYREEPKKRENNSLETDTGVNSVRGHAPIISVRGRGMRVFLASTDPDLLRATEFSLECRGFKVTLLVPKRAIAAQLAESRADIIVLDIEFSGTRTRAIVERIKDDQAYAGIVLIVFCRSRSQLHKACPDRKVLNKADCVLVQMRDESDLMDQIESAARFLRLERSRHDKEAPERDAYEANLGRERRRDKRFRLDAAVAVKGKDVFDEPFEEQTTMINSGVKGACLKTEFHVHNGTDLEISVLDPQAPGAAFDIRGNVVRTELGGDPHESKHRRVAVRFTDDVRQNIEFHLLIARLSAHQLDEPVENPKRAGLTQ